MVCTMSAWLHLDMYQLLVLHICILRDFQTLRAQSWTKGLVLRNVARSKVTGCDTDTTMCFDSDVNPICYERTCACYRDCRGKGDGTPSNPYVPCVYGSDCLQNLDPGNEMEAIYFADQCYTKVTANPVTSDGFPGESLQPKTSSCHCTREPFASNVVRRSRL